MRGRLQFGANSSVLGHIGSGEGKPLFGHAEKSSAKVCMSRWGKQPAPGLRLNLCFSFYRFENFCAILLDPENSTAIIGFSFSSQIGWFPNPQPLSLHYCVWLLVSIFCSWKSLSVWLVHVCGICAMLCACMCMCVWWWWACMWCVLVYAYV